MANEDKRVTGQLKWIYWGDLFANDAGQENPKVAEQFQAVAGLSLGEYTALPLDVDQSRPSHGEEGESTVDGRRMVHMVEQAHVVLHA